MTFEKMVILEMVMMVAVNLALQLTVKCITIWMLEMLSNLDSYLFFAKDAWAP